MAYSRVTEEERNHIHRWRQEGLGVRVIAARLSRSPSSICRELARNTEGGRGQRNSGEIVAKKLGTAGRRAGVSVNWVRAVGGIRRYWKAPGATGVCREMDALPELLIAQGFDPESVAAFTPRHASALRSARAAKA